MACNNLENFVKSSCQAEKKTGKWVSTYLMTFVVYNLAIMTDTGSTLASRQLHVQS